jgi:hypothetical protein
LIALEIGVDEIVNIAKLQFDRCFDIDLSHGGGVITDDFDPAIYAAPVVIGHFQDKEVFKDFAVALCNFFHGDSFN